MPNAHRRKKQPDAVRRSILDAAERIAVEHGAAALTIQAIANTAGVTKGGVTHHFENKQALLATMFADLLCRLDEEIDLSFENPEQPGCFTRAYVRVLLMGKQFGVSSPYEALSLMSISEPALAASWTNWLEGRLQLHKDTDDDPELEIVRLAADGAWLAYIGKTADERLEELATRLINMSRL